MAVLVFVTCAHTCGLVHTNHPDGLDWTVFSGIHDDGDADRYRQRDDAQEYDVKGDGDAETGSENGCKIGSKLDTKLDRPDHAMSVTMNSNMLKHAQLYYKC